MPHSNSINLDRKLINISFLALHLSFWNGLSVYNFRNSKVKLAFFRLPSDRKFSHLSLAAESSPELSTSRRSKRLTVTLLVLMGELNSHFQPTRDFLHSSTTRANFSAGFSRLREIFVVFSLPLMMKILPSRSRIHLCKSLVALWWASMFFPSTPKTRSPCHAARAPYLFHFSHCSRDTPTNSRFCAARFMMIIYYCFSGISASFLCFCVLRTIGQPVTCAIVHISAVLRLFVDAIANILKGIWSIEKFAIISENFSHGWTRKLLKWKIFDYVNFSSKP